MKIGIEFEFPTTDAELGVLYEFVTGRRVDVVGYNHNVYQNWIIKSDSSCGVDGQHGCELVSAPTASYDPVMLDVFYKGIQGIRDCAAQFDDPRLFKKCGLHVHHEWFYTENFNLQNMRASSLWGIYERRAASIDSFWGIYRVPELNANAAKYCGRYLATIGDKYGQINLSNVVGPNRDRGRDNRMPTVEFRQGATVIKKSADTPDRLVTMEELIAWCAFVGAAMVGTTKKAGLLREGCLDAPELEYVKLFVDASDNYGFDKAKIVSLFDTLIHPSTAREDL